MKGINKQRKVKEEIRARALHL